VLQIQIVADQPSVVSVRILDHHSRYMTRCYLLAADEKARSQTAHVKMFTEVTSQVEVTTA